MATLMASKQQPEFNFEEALEELERLVSSMEEGELSLEERLLKRHQIDPRMPDGATESGAKGPDSAE